MLSVEEARDKMARYFEKMYPLWAQQLVSQLLNGTSSEHDGASKTIGLAPPTEAQALRNLDQTMAWVRSWKDVGTSFEVAYSKRNWPAAGTQTIPIRLTLPNKESIAAFCRQEDLWTRCILRTKELAEKVLSLRAAECGAIPFVQPYIKAFVSLSDENWSKLLAVMLWLQEHPSTCCYAREMPIRGIDTKWVESHKKLVWGLGAIVTGRTICINLAAPSQFRARLLDPAATLKGLSEFSASPEELDRLQSPPAFVIICENLISLLTLPYLSGAIGIHGSGYAVHELARVSWLHQARVFYWGDLDSHGFAILSRLRTHLPHAKSIMMDLDTLESHLDLCVQEPQPFHGQLDHLTPTEWAVFEKLTSTSPALRLEQERLPYQYVCERILEAI